MVAVLFASLPIQAQEYLATISGTITDPSGAVVAGAKVTAENDSTHFVSTATTTGSGIYSIPFLTPGNYTVSVEDAGFRKAMKTGVVLTASERSEVDFKLQVGTTNQSIQVTAETSLIDTTDETLGQVLSQKMITDLPNNGRNPFVQATLATGTYSSNFVTGSPSQYNQPYSGTASQMQVNGLGNLHLLLLNGMPDDAPERLSAVTYTDFVPSPEAVQEVNTQTMMVDAQYGHSDSAVINTIIKTGQNQLHGAAYYILQNTDMNANTFQNNLAGKARSVDRWQQPGFVLDGPVILPKLYNGRNRTFFTVAYEHIMTNTPNPYTSWMPDAAERNGDFSELLTNYGIQLYDPNSPVDSNGNRLDAIPNDNLNNAPISKINPVAQALIKYFPNPNATATGYNYVSTDDTIHDHYWSFITRIDHQITPNQKLTGLFFRSLRNQVYPSQGFLDGIGSPGYIHFRNNTGASLDWVSIFSPTLVLDSRVGFVYHPFSLTYYGTNVNLTSLGFPGSLASELPTQTFPGASFSGGVVGYASQQAGGGEYSEATNISWAEVLSKSLSKHNLKWGTEFEGLRYDLDDPTSGLGTFSYSRGFTQQNYLTGSTSSGDPMASFLLGYSSGGSASINIEPAYQQDYWGAFAQDDWQVTPHLNLTLGLRWDYEAPMTERYNRMNAGFCFTCTNPLGVTVNGQPVEGGLLFTSSSNRLPYTKFLNQWQPRFGAAYEITSKLVLRGGFGITYMPTFDPPGNAGFSSSTAYVSSNNGGQTPATSLSNPYPSGLVEPTGSSLGLETLLGQSFGPVDYGHEPPKLYFGAVGVEYQLPLSSVLDVAYVANASRKYQVSKGINSLPAQYLTGPGAASTLNASCANPMAGLIPSNSSLNGSTILCQYLLDPYPEFSPGGITDYDWPLGTTSYNSMQVSFRKRLSHGLSLMASYTWGKEMNQTNYLNNQALFTTADLYRMEASTPNRIFNAAGIYEFPTPFRTNRISSLMLGGWQLNADIRTNDGSLISTPSGGGLYIDQLVHTPSAAPHMRSMMHEFNTCYIDTTGTIHAGGEINTAGACAYGDPGPAWQEVSSSFTLRTPAYGYYMHDIRTQVYPVADASLFKKFVVHERFNFELRGEFFNVFNKVNWGSPNTTLTSTGSSGFGTLAESQANDPRIGQVTARVNF